MKTTTSATAFMKKIAALALIFAMILTILAPTEVQAATVKKATATKSCTPLFVDNGPSILDVYGKDTFKITYDKKTKKIISVSASQKANALGTNIIQRGGIKLVRKTSTAWTYKATWYVNFTLLPKPLQWLAKKFGSKWAYVSNLGRVAKLTVNYTVKATSASYSRSLKLQVPSKVKPAVETVLKMFL